MLLVFINVKAAYVTNQPHQIKQPNGKTISCFVSGDEFFNWIHDEAGYSIIQGSKDAWYYYAVREGEKIVASEYRVGQVDPQTVSELIPWTKISQEEYKRRRDAYYEPVKNSPSKVSSVGQINNIIIYIRFAGEPEISTTRSGYDQVMNNPSVSSLKAYYQEVSYGNLNINSTHYPACASPSTTNASYEDSHPRGYFQPYNEFNNPIGYTDDRSSREHQLLADAINWVNANHAIPSGLNIDNDNDGKVDNVCFMIKGSSGEWADLLWAHRWMLYSQNVFINGKQVYDYTFQPENQVNWQTLCHEMFHAIGAPDLYHYQNQGVISPVGNWDLMESGNAHMGAYMKWKYANQAWINSIPTITANGQYWIKPLMSSTKNCYKIPSPNSSTEFFIVEFRKKITGTFEGNIPNSGLIVYRINSNYEGNADGPPDEVYIYRPYGSNTNNGNVNSTAMFAQDFNRTSINNYTNPGSLLSNNSVGGLDLYNVSMVGDSMSFWVNVTPPSQYQLALNSNNPTWGSVSGAGNFAANSNVTATATPAAGYRFVKWSEIPSYRSSNAIYSFSINHNTFLTAMFAPIDSTCPGGSQVGPALVPTVTWKKSANINAGNFLSFYVTQGATYTWSMCPSNGGSGDYDSELALYKFSNDSLIAYNDDGCGLLGYAKLVWVATFTGKVKLKLSEFTCKTNTIDAIVAYKSNIAAPSCNINVNINPVECGATFIGDGTHSIGSQVVLRTYSVPGWTFMGWFEDGVKVSSSYIYAFTAEASRDLYATFAIGNAVESNSELEAVVYYNRLNDAIFMEGEFLSGTLISVYDITGRKLIQTKIETSQEKIEIGTSMLSEGIYIVELSSIIKRKNYKIRLIKT